MKYFFLAIASFLAIVAQMIAGNNFFLFNFLDLSLLLIAYWAIYRSGTQALFVGSLTGLLMDAVLGWPLGYNGFGRTLAAFVIGQAAKKFNVGETWIRFVIIASSSCLSTLSIFVLSWLLQRSSDRIFLGASLMQSLITAGVGVVLFAALDSHNQAQARRAD
ncbi:MAG TPA: rod shape-determining protein MreD [Acidobacteriota bacterium]|nr:rod shape-determining protein MreD [Acidobacteriota bacterium]